MIKIKKVIIDNIHNVKHREYELDQVNYLVGKNGSGKSTVLQAIQLALLGYIPGKNKTHKSIFQNCNDKSMSATLILDDSGNRVTVCRTWVKLKGSVKCQVTVEPQRYTEDDVKSWVASGELPVFNFAEFCSLSPNAKKDWFIQFLPKCKSSVNWDEFLASSVSALPKLPEQQECEILELLHDTIRMHQITEDVSGARKLNTELKSILSVTKGQLKQVDSSIQSLVRYDDTDSQVDERSIRHELEELENRWCAAGKYLAVKNKNDDAQKQITDILARLHGTCLEDDSQYLQLSARRDELEEYQASEQNLMYRDRERLSDISHQIDQLSNLVSGNGVCPYTQTDCSSIRELVPQSKSKLEALTEQAQELSRKVDQHDLNLKSARRGIRAAEESMQDIQSLYQKVEILRDSCCELPCIDSRILDLDYAAERKALVDQLAKVHANLAYDSMIDKLTSEKYKLEMFIDRLNAWISATGPNGIQSDLMNAPFTVFERDMSHALHQIFDSTVSPKFELEGANNSFSFGLVKDDSYVPFEYLSASEQCMYMLALLSCIVTVSQDAIKLILVDDLLDHLDDENLQKTLESLSMTKDIQFVFAGVNIPHAANLNMIKIERE